MAYRGGASQGERRVAQPPAISKRFTGARPRRRKPAGRAPDPSLPGTAGVPPACGRSVPKKRRRRAPRLLWRGILVRRHFVRRVCGFEHGARLEDGAGDGEEPVCDASEGSWVSMSALAGGGIFGLAGWVVLSGCHVPAARGVMEAFVAGGVCGRRGGVGRRWLSRIFGLRERFPGQSHLKF